MINYTELDRFEKNFFLLFFFIKKAFIKLYIKLYIKLSIKKNKNKNNNINNNGFKFTTNKYWKWKKKEYL